MNDPSRIKVQKTLWRRTSGGLLRDAEIKRDFTGLWGVWTHWGQVELTDDNNMILISSTQEVYVLSLSKTARRKLQSLLAKAEGMK